MPLPLCPYFAFGVDSDALDELTLSLPQKFPQTEEGPGMGDEDTTASGLTVGYYVGWQYAVVIVLRFTDDEYEDVMAAVRWAMQNKSIPFLFRFDADLPETEHSVYLEAPKLLDRIKPTRDQRTPEVWELTLTLRSATNESLHYPLPIE